MESCAKDTEDIQDIRLKETEAIIKRQIERVEKILEEQMTKTAALIEKQMERARSLMEQKQNKIDELSSQDAYSGKDVYLNKEQSKDEPIPERNLVTESNPEGDQNPKRVVEHVVESIHDVIVTTTNSDSPSGMDNHLHQESVHRSQMAICLEVDTDDNNDVKPYCLPTHISSENTSRVNCANETSLVSKGLKEESRIETKSNFNETDKQDCLYEDRDPLEVRKSNDALPASNYEHVPIEYTIPVDTGSTHTEATTFHGTSSFSTQTAILNEQWGANNGSSTHMKPEAHDNIALFEHSTSNVDTNETVGAPIANGIVTRDNDFEPQDIFQSISVDCQQDNFEGAKTADNISDITFLLDDDRNSPPQNGSELNKITNPSHSHEVLISNIHKQDSQSSNDDHSKCKRNISDDLGSSNECVNTSATREQSQDQLLSNYNLTAADIGYKTKTHHDSEPAHTFILRNNSDRETQYFDDGAKGNISQNTSPIPPDGRVKISDASKEKIEIIEETILAETSQLLLNDNKSETCYRESDTLQSIGSTPNNTAAIPYVSNDKNLTENSTDNTGIKSLNEQDDKDDGNSRSSSVHNEYVHLTSEEHARHCVLNLKQETINRHNNILCGNARPDEQDREQNISELLSQEKLTSQYSSDDGKTQNIIRNTHRKANSPGEATSVSDSSKRVVDQNITQIANDQSKTLTDNPLQTKSKARSSSHSLSKRRPFELKKASVSSVKISRDHKPKEYTKNPSSYPLRRERKTKKDINVHSYPLCSYDHGHAEKSMSYYMNTGSFHEEDGDDTLSNTSFSDASSQCDLPYDVILNTSDVVPDNPGSNMSVSKNYKVIKHSDDDNIPSSNVDSHPLPFAESPVFADSQEHRDKVYEPNATGASHVLIKDTNHQTGEYETKQTKRDIIPDRSKQDIITNSEPSTVSDNFNVNMKDVTPERVEIRDTTPELTMRRTSSVNSENSTNNCESNDCVGVKTTKRDTDGVEDASVHSNLSLTDSSSCDVVTKKGGDFIHPEDSLSENNILNKNGLLAQPSVSNISKCYGAMDVNTEELGDVTEENESIQDNVGDAGAGANIAISKKNCESSIQITENTNHDPDTFEQEPSPGDRSLNISSGSWHGKITSICCPTGTLRQTDDGNVCVCMAGDKIQNSEETQCTPSASPIEIENTVDKTTVSTTSPIIRGEAHAESISTKSKSITRELDKSPDVEDTSAKHDVLQSSASDQEKLDSSFFERDRYKATSSLGSTDLSFEFEDTNSRDNLSEQTRSIKDGIKSERYSRDNSTSSLLDESGSSKSTKSRKSSTSRVNSFCESDISFGKEDLSSSILQFSSYNQESIDESTEEIIVHGQRLYSQSPIAHDLRTRKKAKSKHHRKRASDNPSLQGKSGAKSDTYSDSVSISDYVPTESLTDSPRRNTKSREITPQTAAAQSGVKSIHNHSETVYQNSDSVSISDYVPTESLTDLSQRNKKSREITPQTAAAKSGVTSTKSHSETFAPSVSISDFVPTESLTDSHMGNKTSCEITRHSAHSNGRETTSTSCSTHSVLSSGLADEMSTTGDFTTDCLLQTQRNDEDTDIDDAFLIEEEEVESTTTTSTRTDVHGTSSDTITQIENPAYQQ